VLGTFALGDTHAVNCVPHTRVQGEYDMLRGSTLVVAISAVLHFTPAEAQTFRSSFVAVDAVETGYQRLTITGIVIGEASPTTREFYFSATSPSQFEVQLASCVRLALLALNKPGQFVFQVEYVSSGSPKCKLARATP
jgi:hypothetical protein